MNLVQILLPVFDKSGNLFPDFHFAQIKKTLTEKFGGITTYSRSPATGFWKNEEDATVKDDIIVYEVMLEKLDLNFWKEYKHYLEKLFDQDEVIIRTSNIDLI